MKHSITMKFGKEYESKMVPEWREAYLNYICLKKILKQISSSNHTKEKQASVSALKRGRSLYRAFSGLTSRRSQSHSEDETILVNYVEAGDGEGEYQTMLLVCGGGGSCGGEFENEIGFFRRLDDEFNKVVRFWKKRVEEVRGEAEELSKQMEALIALRIKVHQPLLVEPHHDEGNLHMDTIQETEIGNEEEDEQNTTDNEIGGEAKRTEVFRPAPLDVLDHVKINIKPETPVSTIKVVLSGSSSDMSFTKWELRNAELLMKHAFKEFYQKLQFLKSYRVLNQLAFNKILKKYDKTTSHNASKPYLKMVNTSPLGSSDEVTPLMERVEAAFIKHFANGDRRKGMEILRPKTKHERHRITFLSGTFFGCSIALLVALFVALHARDVLDSPGRFQYMANIFPLYSIFGYIFLHMLMYAGAIFFWNRYKVNYPFIFSFKQGTELGHREVMLLSFALATLTLGGVISNLDMEMDPRTLTFGVVTELVPLILLIIVTLILFCPFNIIFRSSRFFFIQCIFHCICAPFYKITLPDFFIADQLTSQVQALRCIEFYICYYGWGDFKMRSNTCSESDVYDTFYLLLAIVPYWIRFLQCLRRLFEEKDTAHAMNGLKYFSTIVAVSAKTINELWPGRTILILAILSSIVATVGNTYWDIVVDWGLLRRSSRNRWLRDELVIKNKSVYFIAMVVNVVLRLAWMQSVIGFRQAPWLHPTALIALVACLEIIRRGIWNFFRLENEHLNNVGKYLALKPVTLPFNYYNDVGETNPNDVM